MSHRKEKEGDGGHTHNREAELVVVDLANEIASLVYTRPEH